MVKNVPSSTASTAPSVPPSSDGPVKFQAENALADCTDYTHEIQTGFDSFRSRNGNYTVTFIHPTNTVTLAVTGTNFSSVRTENPEAAETDNGTAGGPPPTGPSVKDRAGPTSGWQAVVDKTSEDGSEITGHFERRTDA
jgi:hypothetical protein